MDKKSQNFSSRQGCNNKSLQTDARKSSDVLSSKPWPKNSRRRENKNVSNYPKDQKINGGSGRNRPFIDKRPKPKGGWPGNSESTSFQNTASSSSRLNHIEDAADSECSMDFEIEVNSVYAPGSKKQNLNHLLNFYYVPRDDVFGKYSGGNNRKKFAAKQKYNKEQYLQANFQFVINSAVEEKTLSFSQDTLVDWQYIEQINIQTSEEPQCPICLYPPIAAKLTRCGHAYCWPCILHYLALSDKTWRKCPICYEAIHINDLKSTTIIQQNNFTVAKEITFNLMRRKKGTLTIEKFDTLESSNSFLKLSDNNANSKYAKFLKADKSDILSIIEREKHELMFEQDDQCADYVFIQQALEMLDERQRNLSDSCESNGLKKEMDKLKISDSPQQCSSQDESDKYYYFYQSVDGQNIFLHPLNVKMLQTMYCSLDHGPLTISGKILQKEVSSMDEMLRRKFTCLGHLPLACQFEIVEIDLKEPYISHEIKSIFKDEIMLREKTRNRRAREEKKREKQINEINEKQMGKVYSRSANIDITSEQQFPMCGYEDYPEINSPSASSSSASFANILSSPKKDFWPSLGKSASPQNYSELSSVKPVSRETAQRKSESNDEDDSAHLMLPTYHSIGDVLSEAMQMNMSKDNKKQTSKKIGKKSNKKLVLFSSGMDYKA